MRKIILIFLSLIFQSCNELEFKKGDKLCVLNKEVEIRQADRLNQIYYCRYVDNNGVIQSITVLPSEAKEKCDAKNN